MKGFVKDQTFALQSQAAFHSLLVQYEIRAADNEKMQPLVFNNDRRPWIVTESGLIARQKSKSIK